MKAPKRQPNKFWWFPPDEEWLRDQYLTQGKSIHAISQEFGPNRKLIRRWLYEEDIPMRNWGQAVVLVRSKERGAASPHWQGGSQAHTSRLANRVLQESGVEEVCFWCESAKNVVAHHIDGDHWNNKLSNLEWVCKSCHNYLHQDM